MRKCNAFTLRATASEFFPLSCSVVPQQEEEQVEAVLNYLSPKVDDVVDIVDTSLVNSQWSFVPPFIPQIDPVDVMETLYGVDNKLSSQFALMDAKMERHGVLLGNLWCSASHYKSAIDLLEEIRSSHRKLTDLINLVDNKILSDAWKDVSPPAASIEPPETPAINDHTPLPFVDRFLADVVLSHSAAEIFSTCGYRRSTKMEESAALSDIQIQSCLDFGIRRGDYCKPFRVQSWLEELLSVNAIRPVPSNTFQGPEQDVSAVDPLPVPERHDSAVVSSSISGDSSDTEVASMNANPFSSEDSNSLAYCGF